MVRIPYGRLELRLPDGSCNPYLATAAVIAAGLDGVKRELHPGAGHANNLYDLSPAQMREQGIGILPQSLGEAIDQLESNKVIRDALGDSLSEEFIKIKRAEAMEFQRHVSDWEINRYVDFF
jgi:glutamine synthetase